jgi:hypothetical protein
MPILPQITGMSSLHARLCAFLGCGDFEVLPSSQATPKTTPARMMTFKVLAPFKPDQHGILCEALAAEVIVSV